MNAHDQITLSIAHTIRRISHEIFRDGVEMEAVKRSAHLPIEGWSSSKAGAAIIDAITAAFDDFRITTERT